MAAVPSISEHCSRVRTTNVDSAWSAASFVRDGIPRATHLDLVQLAGLMERTSGRPEISIALIDGPVATDHPDLAGTRIREVSDKTGGRCEHTESFACLHGTFVAAILSAR